MADSNPWSAEGWNLTAQTAYFKRYGRARAEARAHDAGSFFGATKPPKAKSALPIAKPRFGNTQAKLPAVPSLPIKGPPALTQPPKAIGLHTDHLTDYQKRVLYFVRRKKGSTLALPPVTIGIGLDLDYQVHFSYDASLGFTMDFNATNLYREIDIELNPGEFSFAVQFRMGLSGPRTVFGGVTPVWPDPILLGFNESQPSVELSRNFSASFALGIDHVAAAFGNQREITADISMGLDEHWLFNEYNAGVFNFDMGLNEAAGVALSVTASMSLGFSEAAATQSEVELNVSPSLGFDFDPNAAHLIVPIDVGFSEAAATYTEVSLASSAALGFTEAAAIVRDAFVTAAVNVGFIQTTAQPAITIDTTTFDFGADLAATASRFANLTVPSSLGFSESVIVESLGAFPNIGFSENVTLSFERNPQPQDILMGFDVAATVYREQHLTVAEDMGVDLSAAILRETYQTVNADFGVDMNADPQAYERKLYGSFITKHDSTSDVVSFSADVGRNSDSRYIAIVISYQSGAGVANVSDVNIGAVNNGTLVRRQNYGGIAQTEIWYAKVTTGTPLTIEYLLSAPMVSSCAVYKIWSAASDTVFLMDSGGDTQAGLTEASTTLNTEKDTGFIIAGSINSSSLGVTTGPPQLTQDDNTAERRFYSGVSSLNVDSFPIDVSVSQSKLIAVGSFSAFQRVALTPSPTLGADLSAILSRTQQNLFPSPAFGLSMVATVSPAFGASPSLGFSEAASLLTERNLPTSPAFGFSMASPVQLEKDLIASMAMGFSEAVVVTTKSPLVKTYRGFNNANNVAQASWSFAGNSIGTASADRWVFLLFGAHNGAAQALNSITIGGVTATIETLSGTLQQLNGLTGIAFANVPSGTTATVVFNFAANFVASTANGVGFDWYTVVGALNTTATDTLNSNATTTPVTKTFSVPDGGVAFAVGDGNNASHTITGDFTTDDNFTQYAAARVLGSASVAQTTGAAVNKTVNFNSMSASSALCPIVGRCYNHT